MPEMPFGSHKVSTLADGALPFLQWDIVVGVTATLLWGLTLRVAAKHEQASPFQILAVAIRLGIVAIALGPCAAAAVALWIRDEMVFKKQRTS